MLKLKSNYVLLQLRTHNAESIWYEPSEWQDIQGLAPSIYFFFSFFVCLVTNAISYTFFGDTNMIIYLSTCTEAMHGIAVQSVGRITVSAEASNR